MNDSDFDVAWRAFAKGDAETPAPARLRPAVMRAWDAAQAAQQERVEIRSGGHRRMSLLAALGAVAAVIVVVGITMREDRDPDLRGTSADVSPLNETASAAVPSRADAFRLIADPTFETESFEIVRLRLPSTSLEAIGVALIGPEVTSLVDIDVVVGGDGLPRAIRGIRPVVGIQ